MDDIYIVMGQDSSGFFIIEVTASEHHKEHCLELWEQYSPWVVKYQVDLQDLSKKLFIVTVGLGKNYRIIYLTQDKKKAIKVATSIKGRIVSYNIADGNSSGKIIVAHRFFVDLDGDRVYSRGTINRYILNDNEDHISLPICTLRRRYNEDLPNRVEVLAQSEETSREIAKQILHSDEVLELLEYNVETPLILVDSEDGPVWRISPCMTPIID